jgi:hypothetical protein
VPLHFARAAGRAIPFAEAITFAVAFAFAFARSFACHPAAKRRDLLLLPQTTTLNAYPSKVLSTTRMACIKQNKQDRSGKGVMANPI